MSTRSARSVSRRAAVVIAAAGAVSAPLACGSGQEREGGPLQGAEVNSLGIPAIVGRALTFSVPVVYNVDKDAEVVLERIEIEKPDRVLELVGALATGNSREANFKDSDDRFPPASRVYGKPAPLRGAQVPPSATKAGEAGVELLIGVRARKAGRIGARGLVVHYRDGEDRYRVRVPNAFVLCANAPGRSHPRNFVCDERGCLRRARPRWGAPGVNEGDHTRVGRWAAALLAGLAAAAGFSAPDALAGKTNADSGLSPDGRNEEDDPPLPGEGTAGEAPQDAGLDDSSDTGAPGGTPGHQPAVPAPAPLPPPAPAPVPR